MTMAAVGRFNAPVRVPRRSPAVLRGLGRLLVHPNDAHAIVRYGNTKVRR